MRFSVQYQGTCVSSFVPNNNLLTGSITVGSPFLRAWHSQFLYDQTTLKAQIGFSVPVNSTLSTKALSVAGRKLMQTMQTNQTDNNFSNTRSDTLSGYNLFSAFVPTITDRGL